jgi:hypothetical protein
MQIVKQREMEKLRRFWTATVRPTPRRFPLGLSVLVNLDGPAQRFHRGANVVGDVRHAVA